MSKPKLTVVNHPLIESKLLQMRKPVEQCGQRQFTRLLRELGGHMAYEVARFLPKHRERIELIRGGEREGDVVSLSRLVVVPIMRSGLLMADGFRDVVAAPTVGHIGVHVEKPTGKPRPYLAILPEEGVSECSFIIVDPVIATGSTALRALEHVAPLNPASVIFVTLIASPVGCRAVHEKHPQVHIFCAATDKVLPNGRLSPGLGSISGRLFGFQTITVRENDAHK